MKVKIKGKEVDVTLERSSNTGRNDTVCSLLIGDWWVIEISETGYIRRCEGIGNSDIVQRDDCGRMKIQRGNF